MYTFLYVCKMYAINVILEKIIDNRGYCFCVCVQNVHIIFIQARLNELHSQGTLRND